MPARRVPAATSWLAGLAVAGMAVVPVVAGGYTLYLATEAMVWSLAAAALGLLVGHAGVVSLGHAAFFGIGAYSVGLLVKAGVDLWVGLGAAVLLAAAFAALTGPLALRGHGVVVLMVTLAFAQMVYSAAYRWKWLTGGDDGLALPKLGGRPELFYAASVVLVVACVAALRRLVASPYGQALEAIRQNESKARALGIPAFPYKLAAYTLSAALTGLAGGLLAIHRNFVSPHDLYWVTSATLLVMVLLGGSRGFVGAVVGATLYVFLQAWVSSRTEFWSLFLGLVLVLTILGSREGLWGLLARRWSRRA